MDIVPHQLYVPLLQAEEKVLEAVRRHFRPELLNRLDDIVCFHQLNVKELRNIARMQLTSLVARLKVSADSM